jgi:hypothetical protein
MKYYVYTGEDKFFIKKGKIIKGNLTKWSVKNANNDKRQDVFLLYIKKAGFNGEDMPINSSNLIELV